MRHASGFSCHTAADAVRFPAKQGDRFLLLVLDFNVVHAGQLALMLHPRGGGQRVPGKARTQKIDGAAEATAASPWLLQA
jgi:hypothetical protein